MIGRITTNFFKMSLTDFVQILVSHIRSRLSEFDHRNNIWQRVQTIHTIIPNSSNWVNLFHYLFY